MLRVMLRLFSRKLLILKQCYVLRFFGQVYGGATSTNQRAGKGRANIRGSKFALPNHHEQVAVEYVLAALKELQRQESETNALMQRQSAAA